MAAEGADPCFDLAVACCRRPAPLHVIYPLARLPLWLWRKAAMTPKPKPKRKGVGST